jgi:hypothetical protein
MKWKAAMLLCAQCGCEEQPRDHGWVLAAVQDESGMLLRIAFCPDCARRELAPDARS